MKRIGYWIPRELFQCKSNGSEHGDFVSVIITFTGDHEVNIVSLYIADNAEKCDVEEFIEFVFKNLETSLFQFH